jgi:serine/threonine protein kinase
LIFSLGVVLFAMYAGCFPFKRAIATDPHYSFHFNKKQEAYWASFPSVTNGFFSPVFKDLLNRMLAFNPEDRPTLARS